MVLKIFEDLVLKISLVYISGDCSRSRDVVLFLSNKADLLKTLINNNGNLIIKLHL